MAALKSFVKVLRSVKGTFNIEEEKVSLIATWRLC